MDPSTSFFLFGLSRAGASVARSLDTHGAVCDGVWTPHAQRKGRPSAGDLGFVLRSFDAWQQARSPWLLLAAADDHLEALVEKIADSLDAEPLSFDTTACHLSGSFDLDVLQPLRARGLGVAAIHPLRPFSQHEREGNSLSGVFCGMQLGSDRADELSGLFSSAGAHVVEIAEGGKTRYHLAAAMASNLVTALLDTSEGILRQACPDLENARDIIGALASRSLSDYGRKGAVDALTGPIERGDTNTIRRHLKELEGMPRQEGIYRSLSLAALSLAIDKGGPGEGAAEAIRDLLGGPS